MSLFVVNDRDGRTAEQEIIPSGLNLCIFKDRSVTFIYGTRLHYELLIIKNVACIQCHSKQVFCS